MFWLFLQILPIDKKVDWLLLQKEMLQLCPILWCVLQLFLNIGYHLVILVEPNG